MREPTTIDLRNTEPFATVRPVRQLLRLVLLLAVKDKSSEVRFEPLPPGQPINRATPWQDSGESIEEPDDQQAILDSCQACRLSYNVAGVFYDLVPPPIPLSAIVGEVMALAKIGPAHRPLRHLFRWLSRACGARPQPIEGRMRLLLVSEAIEILVAIQPCEHMPEVRRVVLRLPDPSRAAEEARHLLGGYLD